MSNQSTITARHLITGSWRVTLFPAEGTPALGLATFGADGTMVNAFPPVEPSPLVPGGVMFVSSGHGAWETTGPDTVIAGFVALGADGQGQPGGTGTIRAGITLDADGQAFSSDYDATMAGPAGNTVATEQGTLRATRIVTVTPSAIRATVSA